jgi:hypothetical protein
MNALETLVPTAKERLKVFEDVASSLKKSGGIESVGLLEIEEDDRWVTKKKSILTHTLEDLGAECRKRKDFPTVGGSLKRAKTLGMISLRRT